MEKLSKEDFLKEYGHILVTFSSYYKYVFTFKGLVDTNTILVEVGGNHDDIYRLSVDTREKSIKDLEIRAAIIVKEEKAHIIYEEY